MDDETPRHDVDERALAHLERLARLVVDPSERESLTRDLVELLGFVDQLIEVDVDGVEEFEHDATHPTVGPSGEVAMASVERLDALLPSLPLDEALAAAPETSDGFFKVPRTVEEG